MSLKPHNVDVYHVFLASPGDVSVERQHVRRFFDDYNRSTAHLSNARFEVIGWDTDSTIGVGRPQELINEQTLKKYRDSLVLVIGIMGQRFGTSSGKFESGTEEEFNSALDSNKETGFPEIKWFFRKIESLAMSTDPKEVRKALKQWENVLAFRKRMQDLNDPIFYTEYPSAADFATVFNHDLNLWMNDPARPWASKMAESGRTSIAGTLPAEFDSERYRAAVTQRFDKVNFEMLDSTGAYYSGVRLWSVFVPQSARECHQYNPRLLEIPKDHQERLLKAGEISEQELADSQQQAEEMRREYFQQPLRPVLEVVDQVLREGPSRSNHRLVVLGDPGSGKSSLIRYLALRWSSIVDRATRDAQPIPLVIDLGAYSRWKCDGRKGFVRFLEEAPVWHNWPAGLLARLLAEPGRIVMLLDGLDEIFDLQTREEVVNDIQRFSTEHAQTPIVVTSRVVGYQSQRLRDAEFRHFMLQDLNATQIDAFIDRWHEQTFDDAAQAAPKLERLKKAIRDFKSIAMLAGNPLLLTMMAILNRNQELPRDRVDLYAQASRLLLHQWDTERALAEFPGLSTDIGWREKHDMLRRVASFMQAGPSGLKGNMIDGPTLASLIEDYLHTDLHFPQSRAAARAVVEHLRQRNFILCFVGADSYGFVHRTFLEYFCAADFVHQFNITKTLDESGLLALFEKHCCDDDWREVLRLICSQIDEHFVGQIVESIVTKSPLDGWVSEPLPQIPLAIQLLGEARNTAKLIGLGETVARRIFGQVQHAGHGGYYPELEPVLAEIGPRWPGVATVSGELRNWTNAVAKLDPAYAAVSFWPRVLAYVFEEKQLVCECMSNANHGLRRSAVRILAEKWPDESTRTLLLSRSVEDQHESVRSAALDSLAATWPDESTRELLRAWAVDNQHADVRSAALQSLAATWPDETMRELLRARAVEDQHASVRSAALQSLAKKWPDKSTRELLRARAVEDQHEYVRGVACRVLGKMHSGFGRIVGTRDLDGSPPYLDPLQPISSEQIQKAATKAGIAAGDLEAQIASLNQHLGWDIRVGAKR